MMDTRNKRASAIGIGLAFRLVLPLPDAVVDQIDRPQVAYSYVGISAQPVGFPEFCDATVESLMPSRGTESLMPENSTVSLMPERDVVSLMPINTVTDYCD